MHIHILTTGGTIDKVYFDAMSSFQVGEPQIGEVLKHAHVAFDYTVTPVLRKDSLEFVDSDRELLRQSIESSPHRHFLVTHGTDTMTVTGQYLQDLSGKTVVLTGSLTPARFKESDALFNIGFALAAVQLLPAGVYLAMNGQVYPPDTVRKDRERNRFVLV